MKLNLQKTSAHKVRKLNMLNRRKLKKGDSDIGLWVVIIIGLIYYFGFYEKKHEPEEKIFSSQIDKQENEIDRDEAIQTHWDEIKNYISGSETIEACSSESGNCYDLEAEISNGQVEQINFANGGYLNFSADIDETGDASDSDQDGNNWDFNVDMNSPLVDDAVTAWASDEGYILEN